MGKSIQKREPTGYPLPPEEWDFHEIEPWEVDWCVRHEYARECPQQTEKLSRLVVPEVIRYSIGVELARERAIETGKQTDFETWEKKFGLFYYKHELLRQSLWQLFTPGLVIAIETAARFGIDYRKSWITQRNKVLSKVQRSNNCIENLPLMRLEPLGMALNKLQVALRDVYTGKLSPRFLPELMSGFPASSVRRYSLNVDWSLVDSAGMEKLRAQFMREVNRVRPAHRVPGRAAEIPYDDLRALAAWRLSIKAELDYDSAQEFVKRRAAERGVNLEHTQVLKLPYYESLPGWKKATGRGNSLIRNLQNPKLNSAGV